MEVFRTTLLDFLSSDWNESAIANIFVDAVQNAALGSLSEDKQKLVIEMLIREGVYSLVDHEFFSKLPIFLAFIQDCSLVGDSFGLNIVEELVDIIPFWYFKDIIVSYLAQHLGQLRQKERGLQVLRICNEMLRRCSRFSDSLLCGEITLMMAQFFPPSEKSGHNPRGDKNIFLEGLEHLSLESIDLQPLLELLFRPNEAALPNSEGITMAIGCIKTLVQEKPTKSTVSVLIAFVFFVMGFPSKPSMSDSADTVPDVCIPLNVIYLDVHDVRGKQTGSKCNQ